MHCTLAGKPAWWRLYVLLAMVALANFFAPGRGWAQSLRVPLGRAAQFGLLSGQQVTAGSVGAAYVAGGYAGGATGVFGGVSADSGVVQSGPVLAAALTDVAAARTVCTNLPKQGMITLANQRLGSGAYEVSGNAQLSALDSLVLTGSPTNHFVVSITGDLTLDTGAVVTLRGVAPGNVVWHIGGNVTLRPGARLDGVVLAGGGISVAGPWRGRASLLAGGDVVISHLLSQMGGNLFPSPARLVSSTVGYPWIPQPVPSPSGPCSNLVYNGTFEAASATALPGAPTGQLNLGAHYWYVRPSEVAGWQDANEAGADWFHATSRTGFGPVQDRMTVPTNYVNYYGTPSSQPGHRQSAGYLGIYTGLSGAAPTDTDPWSEYAYQQLADPLVAGKRYYVEFFSLLTSTSPYALNYLGARLTFDNPYQNTRSLLRDPSGVPLPATIQAHEPAAWYQQQTLEWKRTAGCYVGQGGERFITVGRFGGLTAADYTTTGVPIAHPPYNNDYRQQATYFLDNVGIYAFPEAIQAQVVTQSGCKVEFALSPDCPLPTSSNALYTWKEVGGPFQASGVNLTNVLLVPARYPATITLTTTVRDAAGNNPQSTTAQIVLQSPVVSASAGGPYTICDNTQPFQLTGGTGSPATGQGYWSSDPANPRPLPIQPDGTISASAAVPVPPGTYSACYIYKFVAPGGQTCDATACTTVDVRERRCESDAGYEHRYKQTTPSGAHIINAGGGSFTFGPGRTLVQCPTLLLVNGTFQLDRNSTLLMEGGTRLEVGDGATLIVIGGRITAACTDPWDGLYLLPNAAGLLVSGYRQQAADISHSRNGIQWARPDLTPCELSWVRFSHNLVSLECGPRPSGATSDVHPGSAIVGCEFDSNPEAFKTCAPTYSYGHLVLGDWNFDKTRIEYNTFDHSLLHIYGGGANTREFGIRVGAGNQFRNGYLASLYFASLAPDIPSLITDHDPAGGVQVNSFALPLRDTHLPAALLTDFYQRFPDVPAVLQVQPSAVWVAEVGKGGLRIEGATFTQPTPFGAFPVGTARQLGVWVNRADGSVILERSRFENLGDGMGVYVTDDNNGFSGSRAVGNEFINCGVGLRLFNGGGLPAAARLYTVCNTFTRSTGVAGNSVGLLVTDGSQINIDVPIDPNDPFPPAPNTQPIKNLFTGEAPAGSRWEWLRNENAAVLMPYATFPAFHRSMTQAQRARAQVNLIPSFSRRVMGFNPDPSTPHEYLPSISCREQEGLATGSNQLRQGMPSVTIGQPTTVIELKAAPNPADQETSVHYACPATAHHAELLVRDVLTGAVVKRFSLPPRQNYVTLPVADLQPGVYAYTLTVDGVGLLTRRLLVNR